MVNINDLTIKSLETIGVFDILTGEWKYTLDELQNATIGNTEDTVDITGKGGRLINTLKRNKAATISAANGLVSGGLLETQTGGKFENMVTKYRVPDYLTVNADSATLSYKASGTPGNEVPYIYVKNNDSTQGKMLTQGVAAAPGVYTYDPDSKLITFNAGDLTDGTNIVVWYDRQIQANVLSNVSDKYSEKVTMYVDAIAEEKCSNKIYHVQYFFPAVELSGNFDFTLGDAQTVHNLEGRSVASACSGSAKYWDMIVVGDDAEDFEAFVPVTNIYGVAADAIVGTPLILNATVTPADATNKNIAWGVKDASTSGASINGNELSCTGAGTAIVTATIANGLAAASDYTQDFNIVVSE